MCVFVCECMHVHAWRAHYPGLEEDMQQKLWEMRLDGWVRCDCEAFVLGVGGEKEGNKLNLFEVMNMVYRKLELPRQRNQLGEESCNPGGVE